MPTIVIVSPYDARSTIKLIHQILVSKDKRRENDTRRERERDSIARIRAAKVALVFNGSYHIPRISNKFNRELLNILVISRMLQRGYYRVKDTSSCTEMLIFISNFSDIGSDKKGKMRKLLSGNETE